MAAGNIDLNVVVRGQQQLDTLNKKINQAQQSSTNLGKAAKYAATAIAAFATGAVVKNVIQSIRTFEDLRATLVTIQGDAEAAAGAFALITKFTATTTFQLDDVSQGFITLRNAGLYPTIETMTELGNIAAGMGKNFQDVARAVFNATTGEFEMLKQLGIKVKTEGDNITASFRGVQTTMKKDADSIVNYLRSIGKEDFAGAIEARSKTLSGAFSNLGDSLSILAMNLGEGGLTQAITDITRDITGWIEQNNELVKSLGQDLGNAAKFAIKNIEEITFAVSALTLVFAKSPIGRVISGIVALGTAVDMASKQFQKSFPELSKYLGKGMDKIKETVMGTEEVFDDFASGGVWALESVTKAYDDQAAKGNQARIEAAALNAEIKKLKDSLPFLEKNAQAAIDALTFDDVILGLEKSMEGFHLATAQIDVFADSFKAFGSTASSELTDVIFRTKSLDEALSNIAKATLRTLIQGFINLGLTVFILEPLAKWLRSMRDGQRSLNSELQRTLALETAIAAVKAFSGFSFFADGGPITAGTPAIVGERGPELFVPNTSGQIISNSDLTNDFGSGDSGMGGGGDNVNVTFNINTIDATDFDELLTTRQDLIIGLINRGLAERGKRSLTA
jgi:hypothetical protein